MKGSMCWPSQLASVVSVMGTGTHPLHAAPVGSHLMKGGEGLLILQRLVRHGKGCLTSMATPCSTMWSKSSGSYGSPTFSVRCPARSIGLRGHPD